MNYKNSFPEATSTKLAEHKFMCYLGKFPYLINFTLTKSKNDCQKISKKHNEGIYLFVMILLKVPTTSKDL